MVYQQNWKLLPDQQHQDLPSTVLHRIRAPWHLYGPEPQPFQNEPISNLEALQATIDFRKQPK